MSETKRAILESVELKAIIERLIPIYCPQAIFLFGSRAWGEPAEGSDIDLLVEVATSTESRAERIRKGLRATLDIDIPIDLLVLTTREIEDTKEHPSTLTHKILEKGIKIYEAA